MKETNFEEIKQTLTDKGASLPCSRCGNVHFNLEKEISLLVAAKEEAYREGVFELGNKALSAAVAICENCGAITLHEMSILMNKSFLDTEREADLDGE